MTPLIVTTTACSLKGVSVRANVVVELSPVKVSSLIVLAAPILVVVCLA